MFEVGSEYMIVTGSAGEENYRYGVVQKYEHPIIEFKYNERGQVTIYNVGASSFLRAEKRS